MLRDSKPFHFIHLRKIWYLLSGIVIIIAIASLCVRGLNFGIDFTGGSMLEIRVNQSASIEQVREVMDGFGLGAATIQRSDERDFIIRTKELTEDESKDILQAMEEKFDEFSLLRNERVGPIIGQELLKNALLALLVSAILMVGYVAWRFELKQGIAAVISLLHDVLIVIGVFSLLQLEVDAKFVAAILIIIGYSINDRIVIFDRIRENMLYRKKGEELADVINNSLWQTMARSINTGLTVIFVVASLYVLGGSTLKNMTFALLIGVIVGIYSSVSNASPLWYDLRRMEGSGSGKSGKGRKGR